MTDEPRRRVDTDTPVAELDPERRREIAMRARSREHVLAILRQHFAKDQPKENQ